MVRKGREFMKRCTGWRAFALALWMAAACVLSACGSGEDAEPGPTLEQETDPGKEVLIYARTLPADGVYGIDREVIDKFNRTHDGVRIVVKDYYGSEEDKEQGYERLRTEIAAGQIPDIIDLAGISYRQMVRKGCLEDLWPYIENDPALGRDGVLEAPLKAAGTDGKLYAAFGSVIIDTLVGSAEQVGDRTSWTFQELRDAFANMPEDATLLRFDTSRELVALTLMMLSMEDYVDWETGACSFDSHGFRSMLEFIGGFPTSKEVEEETAAFADFSALHAEAEDRFMRGLQMLDNMKFVSLTRLQELNARHGGRCAFVGYPVEDGGTGSSFQTIGQCLVMSSACKNKEAAWDLIRTVYLNPKDGSIDNNFAIPVRKALYDSQKAALMDGEQKIVPFPVTGQAVTAPPLTEEEVRRFEDFFNSIDKSEIVWDSALSRLILETCGPFFGGDKTLDETVDLLQNRVGLYVREQM